MKTEITVNVYNVNCLKQKKDMVISVDNDNKLILEALDTSSENQKWKFILNLTQGAKTGGYSLVNVGKNQTADQPASGQQIGLNDDLTPFGSAAYCWTLWPIGDLNNEPLWAIQSYNRGDAMDADNGGCDSGTKVLFWGWNDGNNQKWIIRPV